MNRQSRIAEGFVDAFEDMSLTPALQVNEGPGTLPRPAVGAIDIGAFEYRGANR
mgnify:CR=1 FL=1